MLILDNITYSYHCGSAPALAGVSARVDKGIHLLVGENGAGKTTLLQVIAGLLKPSFGACFVDDERLDDNALQARSSIFLLEENMCFPTKTIREFARVHAPFYTSFSQAQFDEALSAFSLTGNEKMQSLSLGNRKKTQLAYALALNTKYLFLDEPTNGLDIGSKEILLKLIAANTSEDATIIISTHSINELEHLYDGILVINKGNMTLCADAAAIEDSLAFVTTKSHLPGALYEKAVLGGYRSIIEAKDAEGHTSIDWKMLYLGINAPGGDRIVRLLNKNMM